MNMTQRNLLQAGSAVAGATVLSRGAGAQSFSFTPNQRYPDPAVQSPRPELHQVPDLQQHVGTARDGHALGRRSGVLPRGRLSAVQRYPEQPDHEIQREGRQLHRLSPALQLRQRQHARPPGPSRHLRTLGHAARDAHREGRQDHGPGRQLRGQAAQRAQRHRREVGRHDLVHRSTFGINGEWEGDKAKPEQATANVYRIGADGKLSAVITDLVNPNGLAFSPDEKKLYVVEWKGTPNRSIWSYDVSDDGKASNKTKLIDAADQGALDGFRVDRDDNLWCGWGSTGALNDEPTDVGGRKVFTLKGKPEDLDGVMVFNPQGKAIAFIRLPERCPNLCFGGPKNNRLYMASSHSLYALYVEAHGAV